MRARIALWAHEGHSNTAIARESDVSVQTVCLWRKRIAKHGAQGIREGEHSGRPPRITHEARLQLIALACETQEPEGRLAPGAPGVPDCTESDGLSREIQCDVHNHILLPTDHLSTTQFDKDIDGLQAIARHPSRVQPIRCRSWVASCRASSSVCR